MLEPRQLNDADEAILDFMAEDGGRLRPVNIAEATDLGRSYVSQRLKRLKEHGHVARPHAGLYELVEDPRE
jgi:DNA-binding IclR family transcriptional regulator